MRGKLFDKVRVVGAMAGQESALYMTRNDENLYGVSFVKNRHMNNMRAARKEMILLEPRDAKKLRKWLLGDMSCDLYLPCHCWGEVMLAARRGKEVYFEIFDNHFWKYSKRKFTDEVAVSIADAKAFAKRLEESKIR